MDLPETRARLARIAPSLLGQRIKSARIASGLTQSAVTNGQLSVGYLSRIESGKRRPDVTMLGVIGDRLGLSAEHLLAEDANNPDVVAEEPLLDFAEIAVGLGDAETALSHLDNIDVARLNRSDRWRVQLTRAQALEATGDLNAAIDILERVQPEISDPHHRVRLGMALSRCYRELGEYADAIRVGEESLAQADVMGLAACDESVQLSVVVASAYFEKGDRDHAVRICRRAIDNAEALGSAKAKASAYWNASVMSMEQGQVADAVPLARQALTLLNTGADERNLAGLQAQVGLMELRLEPPQVGEAREHLNQATAEMQMSHATRHVALSARLGLARCDLLDGLVDAASIVSADLLTEVVGMSPLLESDAVLLAAQVADALGDTAGARQHLLDAVFHLTAAGNDRAAAERWMDLGALLESVEEWTAAKDAYRSAAVASGLRPRLVPARVHQAVLTV